jgi:hypothetical protein
MVKDIKEDAGLVAFCGLYCGACGSFLKERCMGCAKNEKASWCKIRICCKDKGISSCAECSDFADVSDCKKFNNFMSKIFGLIFRSDRKACIEQIKKTGRDGHAKKMAGLRRQSLKKQ